MNVLDDHDATDDALTRLGTRLRSDAVAFAVACLLRLRPLPPPPANAMAWDRAGSTVVVGRRSLAW